MRTIIVSKGQTIENIAVQYYGSREGVINILQDNNLGLDGLLLGGQELLVADEVPELNDINRAVERQLRRNNIVPNSGMAKVVIPGDSTYFEDDYVEDDYVE